MTDDKPLLMINPRSPSYLSLLDADTIAKICEYLDLYDLLQIGELDVNYQRIIGERLISKMPLDISSISKNYSVRHAFKQFGEYATALIIKESDIQYKDNKYSSIEEIFRLIDKRCTVGLLKSVQLNIDKRPEGNQVVCRIPNAFKEIESLHLAMSYHKRSLVDLFLNQLLSKCVKLRSLELHQVDGEWQFLRDHRLDDLKSISLKRCSIQWDTWKQFIGIGVRPLKSLEIKYCEFPGISVPDLAYFVSQIATAFPCLKKFSLAHYTPYLAGNLQALENLSKLKHLTINGFIEPNLFDILLKHNKITKLLIAGFPSIAVPPSIIQNLTSLRSIEIAHYRADDLPFIFELLKLPQFKECILNSYSSIKEDEILEIVASSRYLHSLKIVSALKITMKLYRKIVSLRKRLFPDSPPLHLYGRFNNWNGSPNVVIHKLDWNPSIFYFP